MNLAVLLIAAYLPLIPVMYLVIRSGAFGKGSVGTLIKLFFLGVAVAVPAFLMEAGLLLAVTVLLHLVRGGALSGGFLLFSCILRYVLATALVEELCKLFVLRAATWKQMTMEKISDGTAAAAVVGAGFSAVMILVWLAAWRVVPEDMAALRNAMPDYLRAGAVIAFLFALLYIPSHFGYSGFMGSLYGVAKGSEQKNHGGRAGFMLFVSFMMPFLVHSLCIVLIGYGIAAESLVWTVLGLIAEAILAAGVMMSLSGAKSGGGFLEEEADAGVDFADSEEFADFAEAAGEGEGHLITADGDPTGADGGLTSGDGDFTGTDGSFGSGDGGPIGVDGDPAGPGNTDSEGPESRPSGDGADCAASASDLDVADADDAFAAGDAVEGVLAEDAANAEIPADAADAEMYADAADGKLPAGMEDGSSWGSPDFEEDAGGGEEEISPQREISLLNRLRRKK